MVTFIGNRHILSSSAHKQNYWLQMFGKQTKNPFNASDFTKQQKEIHAER